MTEQQQTITGFRIVTILKVWYVYVYSGNAIIERNGPHYSAQEAQSYADSLTIGEPGNE